MNDMTRRHLFGTIVGLVLLVGASEAQHTAQTTRPAVRTVPVVTADTSIQQLMATMIDPASKVVFEAVSTVTVKGKEQQKVPHTDAEWTAVRQAALQMLEGSKLIADESRHVARNLNAKGKEGELGAREIETLLAKNRPAWNKFARELGEVAQAGVKAAEKKDVDGVFGTAGDLDSACENCHLMFWYPDQDKLFEKPAAGR